MSVFLCVSFLLLLQNTHNTLATEPVGFSPHQAVLHNTSWGPTVQLRSDTVYLERAAHPTG